MATFNPQFQTPDIGVPNFREVTQPQADKSTGIALETLGKGLEGGAKFVDTEIKEDISDQLHKKIIDKQDQFLGTLDSITKSLTKQPGNPLDARAEDTGNTDVLQPKEAAVPPAITQAMQRIRGLQNGVDAQKLTKLGLDQHLMPILKDLRNSYPGYIDYIDRTASSITGYNIANKLISDKIAQINELVGGQKKEQDYYEKALMNSGFDGADRMLEKFRRTGNIPEAQNFLTKNNIAQQKVKDAGTAFELAGKTREELKARAEAAINEAATYAATSYYANRRRTQDDQTDEEITNRLLTIPKTGEAYQGEARALTTMLEAHKARNIQELTQYAYSLSATGPDGKKYNAAQAVGATKLNEIIEAKISSLYNAQIKMAKDDQLNLIHGTQNAIGDSIDSTSLRFINAQDPTGAVTRTAASLSKLVPQMSPTLVDTVHTGYRSPVGGGVGPSGYVSDLQKLAAEQFKQAVAQTNGDQAYGPAGTAYTFSQAQRQQDEAAKATHATPQERSAALKSTFEKSALLLKEKDPQLVDNGIKFFFLPSERNNLNRLSEDYYDPERHVLVTGRTGAFSKLTENEVARNIYKRGTEGNSLAWDYYKQWATDTATAGLTTIAKTWNINEQQLKTQQVIRGAEGNIPSGTDHHFYYNTDTHQIGMMDLKGNEIDVHNSKNWVLYPDMVAVRNANKVIEGLANVAKQEKDDPKHIDAYIYRNLTQAGWDISSAEVRGQGADYAKKIVKAISTANQPPPEKKEKKE
jgi:hypothetical protein